MNKFKKILRYSITIIKNPISFFRLFKGMVIWFSDNPLLRLANKHNTDKGFIGHGYVRIYDSFFNKKRKSIKHICEIGLLRFQKNKNTYSHMPSLKMWSTYFPNSKLVGFDIKDFNQPREKNCTFIKGDQSSRNDLKKITNTYPEYDIIIEDGLHAYRHQQISLSFLFSSIKPGGYFIIEDLHANVEDPEANYNTPKTIDLLKNLERTGKWESPFAKMKEKKT